MRHNRFEIFSGSVLQLIKSVQRMKSQKMAEYGLKGTNAICLCYILDSEIGLNATELSQLAEIDKAQVSRCVTELTEQGLVYRDDRYGRRYKQKYCLTAKGVEVAMDISKCLAKIRNAVSKNITSKELDTFYTVLFQICQNFSELMEEEN